MAALEPHEVGFRLTDVEILPEYQPLSRLALAGLLAALLSPIALAHPLLWIVPLTAGLLSALALRSIRRSEGELRGSGLAQTALFAALLFGCWAVAWNLSHYYVVGRQARRYAEAWLELVKEGRLYEAHQLTMSASSRVPGNESLEDLYGRATSPPNPARRDADSDSEGESRQALELEELSTEYTRLIREPAMDQLLKLNCDWRAEFRGNLATQRSGPVSDSVDQRYTIRCSDHAQPQSFDVIVTVERDRIGTRALWRVPRMVDPETYRRMQR